MRGVLRYNSHMKSECIVLDGIRFHRYPESPAWTHRNYYVGQKGGRAIALHRYIWAKENGDIPPGFHIHHVDGDTANNAPSNLECIDPRSHSKKHWEQSKPRVIKCEWCGKPREVLRRYGVRFCSGVCQSRWRRASGVDNERRSCPICGEAFTTNKHSKVVACSSSCGSALGHYTRASNKADLNTPVKQLGDILREGDYETSNR